MDGNDFAELTKRVAAADTRRGMVRTLVAGVATAAFGIKRAEPTLAEGVMADAFGFCTIAGFPCNERTRCCAGGVGNCRNGVCGCAKKGKSCINRAGVNCCSRRCRKGRCK